MGKAKQAAELKAKLAAELKAKIAKLAAENKAKLAAKLKLAAEVKAKLAAELAAKLKAKTLITPVVKPGAGVKPTPIVKPAPLVSRESGSKFCATNCQSNPAEKIRKCYINKEYHECRRCTSKTTLKTRSVDQAKICGTLCNSIDNQACNIYGYSDNKLKSFNKVLLKRYGLKIAKRFFR